MTCKRNFNLVNATFWLQRALVPRYHHGILWRPGQAIQTGFTRCTSSKKSGESSRLSSHPSKIRNSHRKFWSKINSSQPKFAPSSEETLVPTSTTADQRKSIDTTRFGINIHQWQSCHLTWKLKWRHQNSTLMTKIHHDRGVTFQIKFEHKTE